MAQNQILLKRMLINPQAHFEAAFQRVAKESMAGLGIFNQALSVHALPFERVGDLWLGVVLTPWSVLAIALSSDTQKDTFVPRQGLTLTLPSGDYAFLTVTDTPSGNYLMLSLKSPLSDFADQSTAVAFASLCMELLMDRKIDGIGDTEPAECPNPILTPSVKEPPAPEQDAPLSRRALLSRNLERLRSS